MEENNRIGYIVFGFIFFIIILAIIGFIIWRFVLVHPANVQGQACVINSDCSAGHYCGGGNVCVSGVSGGTEGAVCMADYNCEVGLKCRSDGMTLRCTKN